MVVMLKRRKDEKGLFPKNLEENRVMWHCNVENTRFLDNNEQTNQRKGVCPNGHQTANYLVARCSAILDYLKRRYFSTQYGNING